MREHQCRLCDRDITFARQGGMDYCAECQEALRDATEEDKAEDTDVAFHVARYTLLAAASPTSETSMAWVHTPEEELDGTWTPPTEDAR